MNKLVCECAVAPLRREASDRSEMVSQVLYGESMQVLDELEKWYLVRLSHDHYEGWVDKKQVSILTSNAQELNETKPLSSLYSLVRSGEKVFVLPAGAILSQTSGDEIELIQTYPKQAHQKSGLRDYPLMFLEPPSLWGGRTFMGIDCSGVTQIVYRLVGIKLQRDAYQQAEQGGLVSFVEESATGDLAFFENKEGRITHVGIILKEKDTETKIIHASGKVRIDNIDHIGIFNTETNSYTHSLRLIKRIS